MKFGNKFWLILIREYIIPNLFAVQQLPIQPSPSLLLALQMYIVKIFQTRELNEKDSPIQQITPGRIPKVLYA